MTPLASMDNQSSAAATWPADRLRAIAEADNRRRVARQEGRGLRDIARTDDMLYKEPGYAM